MYKVNDKTSNGNGQRLFMVAFGVVGWLMMMVYLVMFWMPSSFTPNHQLTVAWPNVLRRRRINVWCGGEQTSKDTVRSVLTFF